MAWYRVVRATFQLRGLGRSADKVGFHRLKYTEVPEALLPQGSFLSILGFAVYFLRLHLRLVLFLTPSAVQRDPSLHLIPTSLQCLDYLRHLLADSNLCAPGARDPTPTTSWGNERPLTGLLAQLPLDPVITSTQRTVSSAE